MADAIYCSNCEHLKAPTSMVCYFRCSATGRVGNDLLWAVGCSELFKAKSHKKEESTPECVLCGSREATHTCEVCGYPVCEQCSPRIEHGCAVCRDYTASVRQEAFKIPPVIRVELECPRCGHSVVVPKNKLRIIGEIPCELCALEDRRILMVPRSEVVDSSIRSGDAQQW